MEFDYEGTVASAAVLFLTYLIWQRGSDTEVLVNVFILLVIIQNEEKYESRILKLLAF